MNDKAEHTTGIESSAADEWVEDLENESATRDDETIAWHPDKPNRWAIWKGDDEEPLAFGPVLLLGSTTSFEKRVARDFVRKGIAPPVPLALLKQMMAKAKKDKADKSTKVPGWKTTPGKKTEQMTWSEDEKEWVSAKKTAVPLGLELSQNIRDRGTNRIVGADVVVTMEKDGKIRAEKVEMPSEAASGREAGKIWAARAVALAPEYVRPAARWLTCAMLQLDAPERETLSRATWIGNRLHLPDSCGHSDISENEAKAIWHEIYETILEHELDSAAITIGASVNSPQLRNQGLPGSTVDLDGDSSTGKTTTGRIAVAVWEKPPEAGAEPNWNMTRKALGKRLEERGLLPLLLDDTGTVDEDDREKFLADAVFAVAQGDPRGRLTQSAEFQDSQEYRLNAISTGETPILGSARVGGSARAIELTGPFMPDAKTADRLWALAQRAYGWPGHWLTQEDWPAPELPKLTNHTSIGGRVAKLVAGHAAGFIEIGRILEIDGAEFALAAAQRVVDEAEAALEERGKSAHERFWNALGADVATNPGLWPKLGDRAYANGKDGTGSMPSNRDLHGVHSGGRIWAFKNTVKKIAAEIQVSQTDVLRKLKEDGRLFVYTSTRGNIERISVNGAQAECYVFADPDAVSAAALSSGDRGRSRSYGWREV